MLLFLCFYWKCAIAAFEGLISGEHGHRVLDLLFIFAHWHALAKLRMHTDYTLSILDEWTAVLGSESRSFVDNTCSAFETRELKREYQSRKRSEARKKAGTAATNAASKPSASTGKKAATSKGKQPATSKGKQPPASKANSSKAKNAKSGPAAPVPQPVANPVPNLTNGAYRSSHCSPAQRNCPLAHSHSHYSGGGGHSSTASGRYRAPTS